MRTNVKPTVTATIEVRPADTVADLPILWAIPDRLPRHHLSAIVAPTGAGLTTLAANLCAHLAPCGSIKNQKSKIENDVPDLPSVLYIPGRESMFTTRQRLAAAGADLSRILIFSEVEETISDDHHRDTRLRDPNATDHNRIGAVLREHKSIRLVLIDNAEDLFLGSNRPSRNKLLRQISAFHTLAQTREVAVTFLTSIPAITRDPFRSSFLGALRDVCRTIHLLAPEPDNLGRAPIKNQNSKIKNHLLFCLKNTLGPLNPTLRLHLSRPYADQDTFIPDMNYANFLNLLRAPKPTGPAPESRNYAIEVLRELLASGRRIPVGHLKNPAKSSLRYQLQQAGLSFGTVLRAKEQLGIITTRDSKRWYWQLPSPPQTQPSAPHPETCASSPKSAHSPAISDTTPTPHPESTPIQPGPTPTPPVIQAHAITPITPQPELPVGEFADSSPFHPLR